ncbi:peptidoglycan-binding domain-containing protein [Tenacibaculum sp. A30]
MVKQFQKDYMEIEPTGIVESKTLEAIKKNRKRV